MSTEHQLSRKARLYIFSIVLLGTAALAQSIYTLVNSPPSYNWVLFAALTLFSGSFAIKLPSVPARISVSETFVFTAVLLYGAAPGTVIVALDGLIISLWRRDRNVHRVIFNATEPAISIWVAAFLFFALANVQPLATAAADIGPLVLPLLVFTVVYFALNSWLTAVAVSFETGNSTFAIWRQHFLWISLNYFAGASVAILLARNTSGIDLSSLTVIVPLLVVSYLTFKTALQRIEDARIHVDKLNSLYLSTIETFALWIDAKDQVTHGHIRRVQRYALGLAADLGVKDKQLLRALEAAALLHDMGKLAVPEHILNKPGKLTSGEFEKMKLHASIGAQILSSIDFPYPVVPIVRHHHENWDGSGYPDRLAGTDIPIGARILAVVDCFDALTSDRPYRGRLPDEEARQILMDRRGTMYDPLVVDAFMRVHELLQGSLEDESDPRRLQTTAKVESNHTGVRDFPQRGEAPITLLRLARRLSGHEGLAETAEIVAGHLLEFLPPSLVVVFLYHSERDELVAVCARGVGQSAVEGLRVRLGGAISGWVAATREALSNCDPALELGTLQCEILTGLRNVYSTPLVSDSELVGVLTLYSVDAGGFTEAVKRTVDLLCPHVGWTLKRAVTEELHNKDHSARPGNQARFELTTLVKRDRHLAGDSPRSRSAIDPLSVVFVAPSGFGRDASHSVRREAVNQVARLVRENLRQRDLVMECSERDGNLGLVLFLPNAGGTLAAAVVTRIMEAANEEPLLGPRVTVNAAYAVAPEDGASVEELITTARTRASYPSSENDIEAAL